MKAVAVTPPKPNSVHLREIPEPRITRDHEVLVRVLKIGVDATDREINEGLYGNPPPGDDYLILGHECFGQVEAVGPAVTHVQPGDLVTCTVRRPGNSLYDLIGRNDITSETTYYERGINLLHGFLTEYFVDEAQYIVKIPPGLAHLHVLAEPMSCAAKAIEQVFEAQRRLQIWDPKVAYVLGAGQIGLLSTLILRLLGLEVYTLARTEPPCLKAEIAEGYGAHYVSTRQTSLEELARQTGRPDIIVEATGASAMAFKAMEVLNLNGAMVWTSVTGGERYVEVPSNRINLEWVLGNKLLLGSVNGNARHFEQGIRYLSQAELTYPGVTERILTHPVDGLENYGEMMRLLVEEPTALKVYVNVAEPRDIRTETASTTAAT
ncbi:MAG: glucose dehydrogenase [Planctomycetota bacterium]|nr:MAG: glucose dehydrogenase [Planctomycetota bacterium]